GDARNTRSQLKIIPVSNLIERNRFIVDLQDFPAPLPTVLTCGALPMHKRNINASILTNGKSQAMTHILSCKSFIEILSGGQIGPFIQGAVFQAFQKFLIGMEIGNINSLWKLLIPVIPFMHPFKYRFLNLCGNIKRIFNFYRTGKKDQKDKGPA